MTQRDIETATRFGFLDWLRSFDAELVTIQNVEKVEYDLSGFYSDIYEVICIVKYDIALRREDYWYARAFLKHSVINTAKNFDLYKTEDEIEDFGAHFYFVFGCTKKWRKEHKHG